MVSRIHHSPPATPPGLGSAEQPTPPAARASSDLLEQFRAQATLLQRLQATGQLDAPGTELLGSVQEAITFLDQVIGGPLP
ncbi:MAG: hypothetical protein HY696_03845 [Deltaproteobacteria bacterium]|nr:hypothetical protein [Deltaproteobacteria bacterium]